MTEAASPRVALVDPVSGHGGMHFYDFALAEALARRGVAVTVFACDETKSPPDASFEVERSFRRIYGDEWRWRRGLRFARGLLRSLRQARRRRLNLVHYHFFHSGPMELFCVAVARALGFPVVVTAHDVSSLSGQGGPRFGRLVYGLAHGVIAHNTTCREELVTRLRVTAGKIAVIPSGNYEHVAASAPARGEARRRLGLRLEDRVVLFFGLIKEVKGLDLLLEAMPRVCRGTAGVRLVIAGRAGKEDWSKYERAIAASGAADRIRCDLGFVPDERVSDYFASADVVVMPYRRIYQSAVLLMAMSHGRAVLVSDLPGMTGIVAHGETGDVFPAGDADSLARRLQVLLRAPSRIRRLERGALERMRRDFAWDTVAPRVLRVYRAVLEGQHGWDGVPRLRGAAREG